MMDLDDWVSETKEETFPTKIMIATRGGCSFTAKVRNAERSGASMLVVVDTKRENIKKVIMGDDGTGMGIRIPSMLIGKTDGEKLIKFEDEIGGSTLSAEFSVRDKQEDLAMELWFSSNDVHALDFIKEFDSYAHKLEEHVTV